MKHFAASAAITIALGSLLGAVKPCLAERLLQLRPVGPALFADPAQFPTFTLDLYFIPETNGQITPPIRTFTFQSFLLYDRTLFEDVSFDLTIDNTPNVNATDGRPTVQQRNALAPTNRSISSITILGPRTLNSFNSPVDVLGSNPDGFYSTIGVFDGNLNLPTSVGGLAFPEEGFKLGRYTFTYTPNAPLPPGGTVIGFSDLLIGSGQTLNSIEAAYSGSSQNPVPALRLDGVFRATAPVPEPAALAYGLGFCIAGGLICSRRRKKQAKA
jgi:hypothetical protein